MTNEVDNHCDVFNLETSGCNDCDLRMTFKTMAARVSWSFISKATPILLLFLVLLNILLVGNSNNRKNRGRNKHGSHEGSRRRVDTWRSRDKYLIDTIGCRLTNFDPYDRSLIDSIHDQGRPLDCRQSQKRMTYMEGNEIVINKTALPNYRRSFSHCTYKPINRDETDDNRLVETYKIKFKTSIVMHDEFVHVQCKDRMKNVIYDEFYWLINETGYSEDLKKRHEIGREKGKDPYNILIVGIDSTSRLNRIRQMPMTSSYVEDTLKGIDFKGYMKVGDNTFPNLVPLLAGIHEQEDPRCFSNRTDSFDNCPLVFKSLSQRGFVTMYGEDRPEWGSFHFERPGFDGAPVDHYFRPVMLAAFEANKPFSQVHHCIGRRTENRIVLDYLLDFADVFGKQPFFGFTFTSGLSHNSVNTLHAIDHEYHDLFVTLKERGTLDDTVVFFLSDHGSRFGEIRNSRVGHHEDSMPFMYVIVPPTLSERQPHVVENLMRNSRRLVTAFDIHETLLDIVYDRIGSGTQKPDVKRQRGVSLFREICPTRTCKMADIPNLYCVCEKGGVGISARSSRARRAADALLSYVNDELERRTTGCEVLSVKRIIEAEAISSSVDDGGDVRVQIQVEPSNAILEAVVAVYDDERPIYELSSGVNRLNEYSKQSWCVVDPILKKFCFCKDQIDDEIDDDYF